MHAAPEDEWPTGYGDVASDTASDGRGGQDSGGKRLATLVAVMPGAWFRFSREGRYLAAGGELDGVAVRAGDLVGRALDDVVSSVVADGVRAGIADALAAGRLERQFTIDRDGSARIFDVVFAAATADEVVAFVQDVTARVAAGRRVAESERRFRAAVELANEGVWVLDAAGATTFATPRMAEILDCTLEDLLCRSPLDFMDEASRAVFAERQGQRRRGETETGPAIALRTLDGRGIEATLAARPLYNDQGHYVGAVAVVSDETAHLRAERELAESQRQLGAIAGVHDDVFYVGEILADGSYQELFSGPGSPRLLGGPVPATSGFGDVWDAAVHPEDRAAYAAMNRRLAAGEAAELEYRLVGFDGVVRWVHDRARPRPRRGGGVVFDGVVSDITERRAQADALADALADVRAAYAELGAAHAASERLARTDALTGLFNRRHFQHALAAELARSERHGQRVGVVLIDIDHFKRVNDTHGHDAGDQVLQAVATRLAATIRPYDVAARWGGEEFIVLVAGIRDETALRRVGADLIDAIHKASVTAVDGRILAVTASAGAALQNGCGGSPDALVDAADRALYAAKRRGRDRLVMHRELTTSDTAPEEPEAIRLAEGLAIAASIREAIPPLHCQQVADIAELTARQLGLSDSLVLRCRLAGWLHDVGKLAIPDQLLNRTDSLTPDELQTLRRHPEIGAAILQTLPSLRDAAAGVRHHHERYDGSGYPDHLAGDQIPLEARIIAACDAYSSIIAGRPDQPALEHDHALAQLDHAAGKSLDPTILEALKRALDTRPSPLG